MKQPKKLTRNQKEALSVMNLNPNDWMLIAEIGSYLKVVHKTTRKTKMIDKYLRKGR